MALKMCKSHLGIVVCVTDEPHSRQCRHIFYFITTFPAVQGFCTSNLPGIAHCGTTISIKDDKFKDKMST